MSSERHEALVAGERVERLPGWTAEWLDRAHGLVRLTSGEDSVVAVVEGIGSDWIVTLAGRHDLPGPPRRRRARARGG